VGRRAWRSAVAGVLLTVVAGCARNPATGARQLMLVDERYRVTSVQVVAPERTDVIDRSPARQQVTW